MSDVQVNIMMFGGRRCGKTSILAAMQSCFETAFRGSNLFIAAEDSDTMNAINNKRNEIQDYFNNQRQYFLPDNNPSFDLSHHRFKIGLKHRGTDSIVLDFVDYPGEWIDSNAGKQEELIEIMSGSHVVIIAIDSPHLMEEVSQGATVGRYNDRRNYCYIFEQWAKNFLQSGKSNLPAKMILFVPLKCEKYFLDNEMDVLNERVHAAYKETLNFFAGNAQPYEVAITPIFTLGSVKFSHFARKDGEIDLDPTFRTPIKPIYKFTKRGARPEPLYCEQPAVYVLAYLLKVLSQQRRSLYDWIRTIFGNFASKDDFINECNTITARMKKTGEGYEMVNNPLNF